MKSRLEYVREYVNGVFDSIEEHEIKRAAYAHSYGVSQCCVLLALKRGLDAELAATIGLLHDIYSYKTGCTALHSHNGAEMVRVAFKHALKDLFSQDEQTIIKSAIYHHSDKDHVHDEYDELLKDSDVLQRLPFETIHRPTHRQRLLNTVKGIGLPNPNTTITAAPKAAVTHVNPTCAGDVVETHQDRSPLGGGVDFNSARAGDIAETLAEKRVTGERHDPDYMKIVRHFPEDSASDEFKNAWCAAFVYHCCLEAGLMLPIRVGHTAKEMASSRLGAVKGWHQWGMGNGFCHFEKRGFTPQRGDIVIYDNIVPAENKYPNSARYDHMGIVLSCDADTLVVAEGNVDNRNVSDIVTRGRDDTIGCYIRIPEDYSYDGWRIDFKTGEIRVVDYAPAEG